MLDPLSRSGDRIRSDSIVSVPAPAYNAEHAARDILQAMCLSTKHAYRRFVLAVYLFEAAMPCSLCPLA